MSKDLPKEKIREVVIKHSQIHKAVRNVLFNELGVTKHNIDQLVLQVVERRVDEYIKEELAGSHWLRRIIEQGVMKRINEFPTPNWFWSNPNDKMSSYIQYLLKQEVEKIIREQLEISVKLREE